VPEVLVPGRHLVHVSGGDVEGNTGVASGQHSVLAQVAQQTQDVTRTRLDTPVVGERQDTIFVDRDRPHDRSDVGPGLELARFDNLRSAGLVLATLVEVHLLSLVIVDVGPHLQVLHIHGIVTRGVDDHEATEFHTGVADTGAGETLEAERGGEVHGGAFPLVQTLDGELVAVLGLVRHDVGLTGLDVRERSGTRSPVDLDGLSVPSRAQVREHADLALLTSRKVDPLPAFGALFVEAEPSQVLRTALLEADTRIRGTQTLARGDVEEDDLLEVLVPVRIGIVRHARVQGQGVDLQVSTFLVRGAQEEARDLTLGIGLNRAVRCTQGRVEVQGVGVLHGTTGCLDLERALGLVVRDDLRVVARDPLGVARTLVGGVLFGQLDDVGLLRGTGDGQGEGDQRDRTIGHASSLPRRAGKCRNGSERCP
jgi:hypothetical protein